MSITNKLDELIRTVDLVSIQLTSLKEDILQDKLFQEKPVVQEKPVEQPKPVKAVANNDFEVLSKLLESDEWPNATHPKQICDVNSDDAKIERAEGIIELTVGTFLKDVKFLDFGCGEGHMAKVTADKKTKMSVGYDIVKSGNLEWEKQGSHLLTTDLKKVEELGPYNIILLYDVIDHADDPVQVLKQVKELAAPNATAIVRLHPWCGRHGGHLYQKINKAFVHLVFTDEELKILGYKPEKIWKVTHPIKQYNKMFKDAGVTARSRGTERNSVERFFSSTPAVKKRIESRWNVGTFPKFQMQQSFLNYALQF